MSFVVRVIRDAVLNLSKSDALKVKILAKTAFLRSREKPAPTFALKNEAKIAPIMMKMTYSNMYEPVRQM